MTEALAFGLPSDVEMVRTFTESADKGLLALALPEAVTDDLAESLLRSTGLGDTANEYVSLIKSCDFVVVRNREWRLATETRQHLRRYCLQRGDGLWLDTHELLLRIASKPELQDGPSLPAYLRDPAGRAFHLSALDATAGLEEYAQLGVQAEFESPTRTTWLANRLAREQQALGVLPVDSQDLEFLSAMSLYARGFRDEAVQRLRVVSESRELSMPVAVACHLVARHEIRRGMGKRAFRSATALLRRSAQIGRKFGNYRHVAQVQHTEALALLMQDARENESQAFLLLRTSHDQLVEERDEFGVAKVLHTYGQALLGRGRPEDLLQARAVLIRSLEIGQALGKRRHQARVLATLGEVLDRTDSDVAPIAHSLSDAYGFDSPSTEPARDKPKSSSSRKANRKRK